MPQLDATQFSSQLVWLGLCFAVLYVVSARYVLPRLSDLMLERKNRQANDLAQAEQDNEEAGESAKAAEDAIAQARVQAQALVQKQLAEAKAQAQARAEQAAAKALSEAQSHSKALHDQADKAQAETATQVQGLADAIVTQLGKRSQ